MVGSPDDPRVRYLQGASTRDILRKLWEGDPLDFSRRTTERIRERAILIDASRAIGYAMARAAFDARDYNAGSSLDAFLARCIERALDELIADDRNFDRRGIPVDADSEPNYAFLSEALELPPMLGRKACVIFNSMPDEQRRATWAILVEGRSIAEHAAESATSTELVRKYFEDALLLISALGGPQGGQGGAG
jgi:DNA-directed RNA polymerase specialized sigma24 family protein